MSGLPVNIPGLYSRWIPSPGPALAPRAAGKVKYAQVLHDASEIRLSAGPGESAGDLSLSLRVRKSPVEISVLEVLLK
jgi:hypothetical protein